MKTRLLKSMNVSNFRSILGSVHVPLDANVILIHGENGAGKTSLLSALELSLTGEIQSLERADKRYKNQLLHKGQTSGEIITKLNDVPEGFKTNLSSSETISQSVLGSLERTFFSDRCYLPQSLLSELLNIYQDSNNGIDLSLIHI